MQKQLAEARATAEDEFNTEQPGWSSRTLTNPVECNFRPPVAGDAVSVPGQLQERSRQKRSLNASVAFTL